MPQPPPRAPLHLHHRMIIPIGVIAHGPVIAIHVAILELPSSIPGRGRRGRGKRFGGSAPGSEDLGIS